MNDVAVTYPQNYPVDSLLSTQKFVEHGDKVFSTPAWSGWGERIRTSDWLIQKQSLPFGHASATRNTLRDNNSTDNYGGTAGRP